MTDRKKLIEEAAQAMANGAHNVLGWRGHSADERDWYRKDAAIAMAVFEKAHTPTDDERVNAAAMEIYEWSNTISKSGALMLARAALRAAGGVR